MVLPAASSGDNFFLGLGFLRVGLYLASVFLLWGGQFSGGCGFGLALGIIWVSISVSLWIFSIQFHKFSLGQVFHQFW